MRLTWHLFLLTAVLAAVPSLALTDTGPDESDRNRRLLAKYKADPDHYDRLLRDLKRFSALAPERQAQMRQLDRVLHEADPVTYQRLWTVMDRYLAWFERLPPDQQAQILAATSTSERVKVIRDIKLKEWEERLPRAVRDDLRARLQKLPPEQHAAEIAKLKEDEAHRRFAALPQSRPTRPTRLVHFPDEVQSFVNEKLMPTLNDEEKKTLKRLEGKYPHLALKIAELAREHPYLPPLAEPPGGYKLINQLPRPIQSVFSQPGRRPSVQPLHTKLVGVEGRWPEFALTLAAGWKDFGRGPQKLPELPALGACRPDQFPQAVRDFIEKELKPEDRDRLKDREGKWPDYPLMLHRIARERDLTIPGMSLPGPRELWRNAGAALPEVGDHKLYLFAMTDLTPEERADLKLSAADPAGGREKLKEEYFKKHPNERGKQKRPDSPFPPFPPRGGGWPGGRDRD